MLIKFIIVSIIGSGILILAGMKLIDIIFSFTKKKPTYTVLKFDNKGGLKKGDLVFEDGKLFGTVVSDGISSKGGLLVIKGENK